jgi:hypothetical protein
MNGSMPPRSENFDFEGRFDGGVRVKANFATGSMDDVNWNRCARAHLARGGNDCDHDYSADAGFDPH